MSAADHTVEAAGLAEAGAKLDAVEAALRRLDDGSFDRCEVCGASIGAEHLVADPLRTRCTRCTRLDRPTGPAPDIV